MCRKCHCRLLISSACTKWNHYTSQHNNNYLNDHYKYFNICLRIISILEKYTLRFSIQIRESVMDSSCQGLWLAKFVPHLDISSSVSCFSSEWYFLELWLGIDSNIRRNINISATTGKYGANCICGKHSQSQRHAQSDQSLCCSLTSCMKPGEFTGWKWWLWPDWTDSQTDLCLCYSQVLSFNMAIISTTHASHIIVLSWPVVYRYRSCRTDMYLMEFRGLFIVVVVLLSNIRGVIWGV